MSRRLPLTPTIVVAAAIAVMIGLGVWQLQRAGEKSRLLQQYAAAEKLPPIAYPTLPIANEHLPLFRHATGVCLRTVGRRDVQDLFATRAIDPRQREVHAFGRDGRVEQRIEFRAG